MEEIKQRSWEWFKARLNKITGSEMSRVLGGERAWASYARQLREEAELLKRIEDGEEIELGGGFDNDAMAWGRRWESIAIAEYAFQNDVDVRPVGFTVHPEFPFIGCSLDGEVYKDADIIEGVVEAKCPYSESVHMSTLSGGVVPDRHLPQVYSGIWIADVEWGDFISFDPRRDLSRRLFVRTVERDDAYIERLETRCLEFWEFVQSGGDEPARIKSATAGGSLPRLF